MLAALWLDELASRHEFPQRGVETRGADMETLSSSQARFAQQAMARSRLFLRLSVLGVAVALGVALWWWWQGIWAADDGTRGLRAVVITLVLLNARRNLRQHRYAEVLANVMGVRQVPVGADPQ